MTADGQPCLTAEGAVDEDKEEEGALAGKDGIPKDELKLAVFLAVAVNIFEPVGGVVNCGLV